MATLTMYNAAGEVSGEMELLAEIFEVTINMSLMKQSIVTTLANWRQGTAATKTRADVSHTTRKLFRQKGTGRARQGMKSAPHWKGGGVAHGPHPHDFGLSFPKKMRRKALFCALSGKLTDGEIFGVEDYDFSDYRTKEAVKLLKALKLDTKKVLVTFTSIEDDSIRALRNIPNVVMTTVEMVGTYDLLTADVVLFTRAGLEALQEMKTQPLGNARWVARKQVGGAA